MASPFRVVLITAPKGRRADALAAELVRERLAACVNVVAGVRSHYRWKGRQARDAESLLVVKTSARRLPALERWLAERHPYDVPEMLALEVSAGSKAYLGWLAGELA